MALLSRGVAGHRQALSAGALLLAALTVLSAVPAAKAGANPVFQFPAFFNPFIDTYCEPWNNCGTYNDDKFVCLDGVLCPIGFYRCGSGKNYACYQDPEMAQGVVPSYSCQEEKLVQTLFSGPSDGSQITECQDRLSYGPAVITPNVPTANCNQWNNCGPPGSYDATQYDCLNGGLCQKGFTRCGFHNNYQCYLQADKELTNGATYSCSNDVLVSTPGIDDDTPITLCKTDPQCEPYKNCGEFDLLQFACYDGLIGKKGYCRCGNNALQMDAFGFFLNGLITEIFGVKVPPLTQLVCVDGALVPQDNVNTKNDGTETCFCSKKSSSGGVRTFGSKKKCSKWNNCPGLWNETQYDCLDGQLCPTGYSRCGESTCYFEGGVYSCKMGSLVQGGNDDDGTQTSACRPANSCKTTDGAWNNCGSSGYDHDSFVCLDGALCPDGYRKCGNSSAYACYNPAAPKGDRKFCVGGVLVSAQAPVVLPKQSRGRELISIGVTSQDDATAVTECIPNGTVVSNATIGAQPNCTLYLNCEGFDDTTHTCLDGLVCPIGMARCGGSVSGYACYVVNGTHSCVGGQLKPKATAPTDDGSQVTACQNSTACASWRNCPVEFNPETHSCLDGVLCPAGFSKCTNPATGEFSCFDPYSEPRYGCQNGTIVQISLFVGGVAASDNTQVDFCSNSKPSLKALNKTSNFLPGGDKCTPYTNCPGIYDPSAYWCLNGQLCPAGSNRCGPKGGPYSCYLPGGNFSCVNGGLIEGANLDDVTAVGPCQSAGVTYCAPWQNCGKYDITSQTCLDGKLCPLGHNRCPTDADEGYVCYDPNADFQCQFGPPITACANAHDTLSDNLIKNGDFEAFTTKKKFEVETIRPDDASATALSSWTVVPNPFNYVSQGDVNVIFETFFDPFSGHRSVDMSGFSPGAISQTFSTVSGAYYDLTFAVSRHPSNLASTVPRNLTVTVGDQNMTYPIAFGTRGKRNMQYEVKSLTFVALNPKTTLTFAENDASPDRYGCVIDDVAVVVNNKSMSDPATAKAPIIPPACAQGAWDNCLIPYDNNTYWCLDGKVCPAGMKKCGLTSTYACYNNNTQSCVNNQLVSTAGKDDRTSVGFCKPEQICKPWDNCGTDYDASQYACLNGRLCPAGFLACGNGFEFACYDPFAVPSYACVQNNLVLGDKSDGSEITICQDPAYIPAGLNVQRNAHYEGDTITAGSAEQGQCGGTGVAALNADACRTLCSSTQDCHLFELTGQNTATTGDDCCYLKGSAKDYKYAPGTDVYFPASEGVVPASSTSSAAPLSVCTKWTNCPGPVPGVSDCLDGQLCPNGYSKCGGNALGSNSYHCYLPHPFTVPGGVQEYSCVQNAVVAGTAATDDVTAVTECKSDLVQECRLWTNCPVFDPRGYQCMDKLACPIGNLKCIDACYDPKVYACTPTGLSSNLGLNNPNSSTGPCDTKTKRDLSVPQAPNCAQGQSAWTNCPPADPKYWCLDGQNCLTGFKKCGVACYDPAQYGCQNNELVEPDILGNVVSDATPVGPCGDAALVAQKGQIKARAVEETCPAKSTLWTNCAQQFDPAVYWCLNGQLCPVGQFLCGSSCYDPANFGCIKGVLSAFGDVSSDGSEVVACLAATAQLTLTLKKTNGVFSNEDSQAIVTTLSNHAGGASNPNGVSVALLRLDVTSKIDIAKVGVPIAAWKALGFSVLDGEIAALAAQIGATYTVTNPVVPGGTATRRRVLLQVGDTTAVDLTFSAGNATQAAAVVAALQAALAPGGSIAVALSNSGISGVNVTTAPSVTGAGVLVTITVPVKNLADANLLAANLSQLATSGQLQTELVSNGLTGVDATSAQVSILSLTPGQTAVTNATAPVPAPAPSPAGLEPPVGPLAPAPAPVANNDTNHTKSAANGNRGVSFAAWALSVIATIAAGVAVL